ncbi:TPA: ABC transporter permease subunit [Klebsiella oxytoca]
MNSYSHNHPTAAAASGVRPSRRRIGILALLAVGTMINYLDRTVLGIAAPQLTAELGIDAAMMGIVFSAFAWTYALAQIPGGIFLDRFGNFIFPSSFGASVFLIALSTWFPVTVLTWSGVIGIDKAWYDVARTLGASQRFLILRVAIPAALPNVFVGLFMGLGASFSVLIVAEMVGVKSGIGFYLQWAQGWAAYPNMYAALLVMALLCSGLISGLFMVRDRLLSWQRGGMQW